MSYISAETQGNTVVIWERTNNVRSCLTRPAEWYFYIRHEHGTFQDMYGNKLRKLSFKNQFEFYSAKKEARIEGYKLYDSDVSCDLKYVSKHYHDKTAPDLHIGFYDIEIDVDMTRDFKGALEPIYPITAISFMTKWNNKMYVLAVPPENWDEEEFDDELLNNTEIELFDNEKQLLMYFLELIEDVDCLVGYNSDNFDDPYITRRIEDVLGKKYSKKLNFENGSDYEFKSYFENGQEKISVKWSGRTQSDYLQLIKKFEPGERQSYTLASIANEYLPHLPKLTYSGNLEQLYKEDFIHFLRYAKRDCEILGGLEDKLAYVTIANMLRFMSTGYMNHISGTVKLADLAVRNYCWYKRGNIVIPDITMMTDDDSKVDGAYVMNPVVGLHKKVCSVDINSLYPSAIMTLNISPECLIGQFLLTTEAYEHVINGSDKVLSFQYNIEDKYVSKTGKEWREFFKNNNMCVSGYGTVFSMDTYGIFPSILSDWFAERVKYKGLMKQAQTKEEYQYYDRLQYIFKIKLNSFYGALLNGYFRFFDRRMGASVTASGRQILIHQASEINRLVTGEYTDKGGVIVYGDTDSVTGDTIINTNLGNLPINDLFLMSEPFLTQDSKEIRLNDAIQVLSMNADNISTSLKDIDYIHRHLIEKEMWEITDDDGNTIKLSDDHSVMIERHGVVMEAKPSQIDITTDYLLTIY
ncbi:MAG: hypothetical protein KDH96_02410 [Candidatus Riesia sp.]|nr:hypothetical protein [Candidatus Riesia sp.]